MQHSINENERVSPKREGERPAGGNMSRGKCPTPGLIALTFVQLSLASSPDNFPHSNSLQEVLYTHGRKWLNGAVILCFVL